MPGTECNLTTLNVPCTPQDDIFCLVNFKYASELSVGLNCRDLLLRDESQSYVIIFWLIY